VRNHNLVPTIDEDFDSEFEFEMAINMKGGNFAGREFKTWDLKELKNFKT
jgi:hypothetical protein